MHWHRFLYIHHHVNEASYFLSLIVFSHQKQICFLWGLYLLCCVFVFVLLFLSEISFNDRADEIKKIRGWGCDKGHQRCGYKSTLLLLLPLTPVLMKLPVPTNKLNQCLRYQAVIAGRLFSLPNYWYFLLQQLDLQHAGWGGCGGRRWVIIFHLLGQLLRQGCTLWNVFHRLFIITGKW